MVQNLQDLGVGLVPILASFRVIPPGSAIHFEIDLAEYEAEWGRLEGLARRVTIAEHAWAHRRSPYAKDP